MYAFKYKSNSSWNYYRTTIEQIIIMKFSFNVCGIHLRHHSLSYINIEIYIVSTASYVKYFG